MKTTYKYSMILLLVASITNLSHGTTGWVYNNTSNPILVINLSFTTETERLQVAGSAINNNPVLSWPYIQLTSSMSSNVPANAKSPFLETLGAIPMELIIIDGSNYTYVANKNGANGNLHFNYNGPGDVTLSGGSLMPISLYENPNPYFILTTTDPTEFNLWFIGMFL